MIQKFIQSVALKSHSGSTFHAHAYQISRARQAPTNTIYWVLGDYRNNKHILSHVVHSKSDKFVTILMIAFASWWVWLSNINWWISYHTSSTHWLLQISFQHQHQKYHIPPLSCSEIPSESDKLRMMMRLPRIDRRWSYWVEMHMRILFIYLTTRNSPIQESIAGHIFSSLYRSNHHVLPPVGWEWPDIHWPCWAQECVQFL